HWAGRTGISVQRNGRHIGVYGPSVFCGPWGSVKFIAKDTTLELVRGVHLNRAAGGLWKSLVITLIGEEEEGLVFKDRPAYGAAVFVLVERRTAVRLRKSESVCARFFKVARGIQECVAIELESAAVERIGAVLDSGVNDGS